MSDTESFEYALWKAIDDCKIDENADTITGSYIKSLSNQDRVVAAHIREIRDTAQQEYHRGYEDGRHSMDAEHRAVSLRLRQLPRGCTGFSDAHISWFADLAWAMGIEEPTFASLRDELVRLMGGVSDGTAEPITTDELIEYINQDTHRLKGDVSKAGDDDEVVHVGRHSGVLDCACDAFCGDVDGERALGVFSHRNGPHMAGGMVSVDVIGDGDDTRAGAGGRACAADCGRDSGEQEVSDGRLADDCGADTGCGDSGGDLHMAGLVTYDVLDNERRKAVCELRKCELGYTLEWDNIYEIFDALGVDYVGMAMAEVYENLRDRLIHLLGGDQPAESFGSYISRKSVDAMSSRAEDQSQDDILMRVSLKANTYAYQILELADMLGVDVNVGDNVADIGNVVMAKARYLTDECIDTNDNASSAMHSIADELRQCVETATKTYDDTAWHEMDGSEDEHTWCSVTVADLLGIADRIDQMAQANGTMGQPNGTCPDDVPIASITDELRKWASDRHCKGMSHTDVLNIGLIADRVDEQFDRICQQQEAVLQETIADIVGEHGDGHDLFMPVDVFLRERDKLRHDVEMWRDRSEDMRMERDELQAKLDEYDRTHVELPKDANGNVIFTGHSVRKAGSDRQTTMTVYSLTLTFKGWSVYASGDSYAVEREPSFFEVCGERVSEGGAQNG